MTQNSDIKNSYLLPRGDAKSDLPPAITASKSIALYFIQKETSVFYRKAANRDSQQ